MGTRQGNLAARAILRDCFETFRAATCGIAGLSIETSNDLFEMDPSVTMEEVWAFRSKRSEWVSRFDAVLRELFENRLAGRRRKGRRVDNPFSPAYLLDAIGLTSRSLYREPRICDRAPFRERVRR
jgi:hypothetical protein